MKHIFYLPLLLLLSVAAFAQNSSAPLGAVTLVTPTDAQVIYTFTPFFFWTYQGPVGDFETVYSIKITELKDGQTYTDAMGSNVPLVFEEGLKQPSFTYPLSAPALDDDKRYVWQIQAVAGGRVTYLSEIWMFRYKKNVNNTTTEQNSKNVTAQYVHLSKGVNNGSYVFTDKINFRYNNETTDTLLNYVVYREGERPNASLTKAPLKTKPGINYLSIDMPKGMQQNSKGAGGYVLEVYNTRNEKWTMKFTVKSK